MSLPFSEFNGFTFDLRAVPMIIGPLYGGVSTSIPMLLIYLVCRLMMGGPQVSTGLCIGFLVIVTSWGISRVYNNQLRAKKILTGSIPLVLLLGVLDVIISVRFKNHPHLTTTMFMYDAVNLLVLWTTILAVEYVHENNQLLDEVHRADKLSVLGELAASIAHEIRNPLTVSRGFVQLTMGSHNLSRDEKSHLGMAIDSIDRAHEIINDYLSLAKPKAEVYQTLSLEREVQRVVEMLTPYANMSNVAINIELHSSLCIYGNPQKVMRIFLNIMKNGIEAMPTGGTLTVRANRVKEFASVQIADTGIGMTVATVRHLGEPFYSTKHSGTGLGLMASYRYCQAMGGKIKVSSTIHKGTTFEVLLPLCASLPPTKHAPHVQP